MTRSTPKRLYLIPVLSKALDILELLQNEQGPLALEAIYQRTNISKTTVYRILKTFVHRGYLAQSQDGLYRLVARPKKARFGFGSQSAEMPFSEAVTDSLKAASSAAGVDLIVLDNRYDGSTALHNADEFVRNRVDLVIEFQIDQHVAPVLADKIDAAGIPLIAVDIPHPHATFFGVNNYRVGFEAGECLAQYAKKLWDGKVRWALGLDIDEAGPLVQSRVTGAFEAIRSRLPGIPAEFLVRMDARGLRDKSCQLVLGFPAASPERPRHPDRRRDRHQRAGRGASGARVEAREICRHCRTGLHSRSAGRDFPRRQPADRLGFSRGPKLWSQADPSGTVRCSAATALRPTIMWSTSW